ncbi:anthocyanin 3'-O-beta-glucosyltransferase-like [Aegilops tauschii subsp. strangulata]|uniref:Glycosyltransferase n=1 Tax=Aegilops tauschii TaxID=37682 RepID=M8ARM7_AEGTA
MAVKDEQQQAPLHILFFPFPAHGHLIPIADMAALFAARGVRCSILTTPVNAAIMRSSVDHANDAFAGTDSPAIDISVAPFPDVGLPPGVENGTAIKSQGDRGKFFEAAQLLREPFDRFLVDNRPDAVVSDSFFPWSVDAAAEHGVPRLAFLGSSMFALSCIDSMLRHDPLATVPDDPDALVSLPGLPHRVELRRSQLMDPANEAEHWGWAFFQGLNAADQRSFGEDMAGRGTDALSPDADSCIGWLDMKPAGSVVYISFGTLTSFSPAELHELARGLELSGMNFVWVIGAACPDSSEWMPEGFAELTAHGGRGFIIRGWAPQMLILNHPAVGGFLTHCGWNSTLEAVSAGVPMVTWPRYADQFNNEKVIVELLKVGVSIGAKDYASCVEAHEVIGGEVIAESIGRLMGNGEEGDAMRKKAKALGCKARSAVEGGGSSYNAVGRLIDELTARRSSVKVGVP